MDDGKFFCQSKTSDSSKTIAPKFQSEINHGHFAGRQTQQGYSKTLWTTLIPLFTYNDLPFSCRLFVSAPAMSIHKTLGYRVTVKTVGPVGCRTNGGIFYSGAMPGTDLTR